MSRQLHIFDLDGTLLLNNCSLAFFSFLKRKGFFSFRDQLYALFGALWLKWRPESGRKIHEKLFSKLFRGRSSVAILSLIPSFVETSIDPFLRPSLLRFLRQAQGQKEAILLLSSSPSFLVSAIAERLGIIHWAATEYLQDERSCWQAIGLMFDGNKKLGFASDFADNQGLNIDEAIVYSDSVDDLPLFEKAGKKVAVAPDRRLRLIAQNRGWQIIDNL